MADGNPRVVSAPLPAPDFRTLFEASPGLYLILTPDLRIAAVTDAYLSATMTRREDIVGRLLFEVFPDNPDDLGSGGTNNLRASLDRVLETRKPDTMAVQKYDIRRPAAEGGGFEERFWSPFNSPVLGSGGSVEFIIHRVEDVTEFVRLRQAGVEQSKLTEELRTRARQMEAEVLQRAAERANTEAALKDSERSLRLAISAAEIGTWRWDLASGAVEMSERAWGLLGASPEGVPAAEAYRRALHPEDRDRVMGLMQAATESRSEYDTEYRCVHRDGAVRWVAARGRVYDDAAGRAAFMQGVMLDITDRKEAEILRRANLERERAVADAANRAKSEFLAHMSHEVRTPLNGVIGMLDLMLRAEPPERHRRYCELARHSAETLLTVINDILDFSKIEAGKLEIAPVDADLHATVEDVMEVLAQKAVRKGLEMACHIDPRVPALVRCDADRVRQVLINLVNNAIKFTPRGAVVLRLTLDEPAGARATVRFSVTDTGIGIPPDRRDKLFRPFSQADASTTRQYGGTGLGLVISKQLAELMGGSIGVESDEGKGSTFWFTAVVDVRPDEPAARTRWRMDLQSLRVLAVDDNEVHRGVLRDQIASWGLDAVTASDGVEALEALSAAVVSGRPFRVAIVDNDMPRMDGFDLAMAVKSRGDIKDTVLMILLSMEDTVDPARLRSLGFAGHMTRPVRQSQLFDTIMDAIARSGRGPGAAPVREGGDAAPARTPPVHPARRAGLILLAEDNDINQVIASEILTSEGYEVRVVADGRAAVEAVRAQPFDLVLMDCQMPVMDGFEATRAIRSLERAQRSDEGRRPLPIVALTANAMKGDHEACLDAGMNAYLSKPIRAEQLLATIRSLLVQPGPSGAGPREGGGFTRPEPARPAFDLKLLLERCVRDAALAARLLDMFEAQTVQGLAEIAGALRSGDAESARRTLHSLKGAAGMMAAHGLAEAAAQLETLVLDADLEGAARELGRMRAEVDRCLASMPEARLAMAAHAKRLAAKE